ncbi:indoleamine 2,3-dioxygenase [Rhizobium lentis]|uniref:Uncharacterized protein n=1 Tax=Rhizobium lentis TaxID=1138194 RepID=A0A9Q3M8R3_9HYPH|nr:indoleamine 2,3-dioxygenase [Rhizobium lentis]MBX5023918.1 hypothetical protein [Rhizobium lentis]
MRQGNAGKDPAEMQIAEVIHRTDKMLSSTILAALKEARNHACEAMTAIGQEGMAPTLEYFAAVVHQRMYCLMCGADPDTFEGGDPDIAYHVIRNSQNIARHYWSANIEVYPPRDGDKD